LSFNQQRGEQEQTVKLTVLMDNNTLIDRYLVGEPGLSFLIREEETQILFDVGYSGAFLANARRLGLDPLASDFLVLSHGHLDHTWGLGSLVRSYTEARIEERPFNRPTLVAHPEVFRTRTFQDCPEIGCLIPEAKLRRHVDLHLATEPFRLTERLVFLGEIPRGNDFENREPVGEVLGENGPAPDFLPDDTALAYEAENGLVIITGCSHAGICNIIEQARKVCGRQRILDVIGGFHLLQSSPEQLARTVDYFRELQPAAVHPCHCVDLPAKIALSGAAAVHEVGVGLMLEYT
jgi:7,8-dihydropterin-6-yl-methyl-4-(beta-D-ribofuranosyl)aminobenzene 5'-phosphate synthase